jgi:CARDB
MAAARPDLVVSKLGKPPARLAAGTSFKVRDTTRNSGRAAAGASRTAYYLALERHFGSKDVSVGARAVAALARGAWSKGGASVKVPATMQAGSYYLIACADARHAVRERSERDNCRTAPSRTTISPSEPAVGYFPRPADPITVTPALEAGQGVSVPISAAAGGTITATGADGTTYALALPAGALLSDETITMTPVSAVPGSPLGSLVGGVELGPEGLQLALPGTLTITPSAPVGQVSHTGFVAYEGGSDFSLYPVNAGPGIAMTVTHFSTYGDAAATSAQVQTAIDHMPVRSDAQLQALVAQMTYAAVKAGHFPSAEELEPLYAAYYRDVIVPLLANAVTDEGYTFGAIRTLLVWANRVGTFHLGDPGSLPELVQQFDGYQAVLLKLITNGAQLAYQHCVSSYDAYEVVALLSLEQLAQQLGDHETGASDLAQKCGHFELDITEHATQHTNAGDDVFDASIGVEDDIPIAIDATGVGSGQADPAYTSWAFTLKFGTGETASSTAIDAPSKVSGLNLAYTDVFEHTPQDGRVVISPFPPTISLDFDPGSTREIWTFNGGSGNLTLWDDSWLDGIGGLVPGQTRTFPISDWSALPPGSGPLVAQKTFPLRTYCHSTDTGCDPNTQAPADTITSTITLKLYLRPQ